MGKEEMQIVAHKDVVTLALTHVTYVLLVAGVVK